jgi:hypothetical protein
MAVTPQPPSGPSIRRRCEVRHALLIPLALMAAAAQLPPPVIDFTCPMDPDVRSKTPGKCPRCGMQLEAGIQQPVKYRLELTSSPANPSAGQPVELRFEFIDPRTGKRAVDFQVVHEKLFHLFMVSADLKHFVHDHPQLGPDGIFRFRTTLPEPGIYRLLADAYPAGGTPQLLARYLTTAGYDKSISESTADLAPDLAPKVTENLKVALRLDPPDPIPGKKTMLFFRLEPGDGVEPYLGAWGHLLAASNDLVDGIHEHPVYVTRSGDNPEIQFNIFFPRPAMYRVWVQFQRKGVVNTAQFTIPVKALR